MSELANAIKQICEEKGLGYDAVISTIESALAAAYRKDYGKKNQNIVVEFNPENAKTKVFDAKTVVEDQPEEEESGEPSESSEEGGEDKDKTADSAPLPDKSASEEAAGQQAAEDDKKPEDAEAGKADEAKADEAKEEKKEKEGEAEEGKEGGAEEEEEEEEEFKFNPKTMIEISDARMIKKTVKLGEELKIKLDPPADYGRMAAQTAKQVIIQRLREAERDMIYNDFKDKQAEVVSGVVQRREGRVVLVDLGKAVGVLPPDEMIPGERYNSGDRIKVYVKSVESRPKGPEIVLSRISEEILKKVFYLEIPEISNGLIELKSVAREAGYRSKVAVWTDSDNVDPIGSCVGQRGARIQTIISELGGEKVDIIQYDEDPLKYISNALSPARILSIELDEEEKKAKVKVTTDQLSLAIGKGGQNARLAAKLTGWKVDIVEEKPDGEEEKVDIENSEKAEEKPEESGEDEKTENPSSPDESGPKEADPALPKPRRGEQAADDETKPEDKKDEKAGEEAAEEEAKE